MAHVWAARALLPSMVQRGDGYLLSTASAAGLLTQLSALAYSATKHAAVAVAEWISITYADAGIKVSCLCPQGVRTPMLELALEDPIGAAPLLAGGLLDPDEVADAVVAGIAEERFLILPHGEVAKHIAFKGAQPSGGSRGCAVCCARPATTRRRPEQVR
jgi:NAD(P)-dependent dehydrogenase (short-subunit alcohol dehydrogenase family)